MHETNSNNATYKIQMHFICNDNGKYIFGNIQRHCFGLDSVVISNFRQYWCLWVACLLCKINGAPFIAKF